jgi:cobalt-zinc-cadmium resistance protein CzcA
VSLAALIYLNVPVAITGEIFARARRGVPFSISAEVGFIALFGVAVLNGLVLVGDVQHRRRRQRERGLRRRARSIAPGAHHRPGRRARLHPDGVRGRRRRCKAARHRGARRLVTSTVLTLLVLPTLSARLFARRTRAA